MAAKDTCLIVCPVLFATPLCDASKDFLELGGILLEMNFNLTEEKSRFGELQVLHKLKKKWKYKISYRIPKIRELGRRNQWITLRGRNT